MRDETTIDLTFPHRPVRVLVRIEYAGADAIEIEALAPSRCRATVARESGTMAVDELTIVPDGSVASAELTIELSAAPNRPQMTWRRVR